MVYRIDIALAINEQKLRKLQKLIRKHNSHFRSVDFDEYFRFAIDTGNINILQTVLDASPPKGKGFHYFDPNRLFCRVADLNISVADEKKKLEILQCLLPHLYTDDPNSAFYYPIECMLPFIFYVWRKKYVIITEFFINTFYAEKYNSLYPLIKKLEAAVDKSHHICILLHDEIKNFTKCTYKEYGKEFNDPEGPYIESCNIGNVVRTFQKILLKDTRESMKLAVETFQVLLDKNFNGIFKKYSGLFKFKIHEYTIISTVEEFLNIPSIAKLLFQFIYNSINDKKRERRVFKIIHYWLKARNLTAEEANMLRPLFIPFITDPLQKMIPNVCKPFSDETTAQQNGSSEEIYRHSIRNYIVDNVEGVKEFIDKIWSLDMPPKEKCFLLYIPDSSYMDDFSNVN